MHLLLKCCILIQAIKQEVGLLTKKEQKELLHYMVEIIAGSDQQLPEEWKRETDNRIALYKQGKILTFNSKEAMKYAFRR